MRHRIGDWTFDPRAPVLHGRRGTRRLEDRDARALALLCERRGQAVSKAELVAAVWGGRSGGGDSLALVIAALRRALGDAPDAPAHILSVGARGYRLSDEGEAPAPGRDGPRKSLLAGAVALGVMALVTTLTSTPRPLALAREPTRNATGRPDLDDLTRTLDTAVAQRLARLPGVRVRAAPDGGARLPVFRARLILWNGAPALAMTASDARGALLWSQTASGPEDTLPRRAAAKITSLPASLRR